MDVIPVELTALTPAVVALVAAGRRAGLPDRWTPAVAIGLGVAGAQTVAAATATLGPVPALLGGIVAGAAAVGLHQTGKQWGGDSV